MKKEKIAFLLLFLGLVSASTQAFAEESGKKLKVLFLCTGVGVVLRCPVRMASGS